MSAWAVKDATKSWEAVFDRAWAGEPQFVSRGSEQTVVVISLRSYESGRRSCERGQHVARPPQRKKTLLEVLRSCPYEDDLAAFTEDRGEVSKRSLYETLRSCPFGGVELNVERDHSIGRPVELA